MFADPMDELIADLDKVVDVEPQRFNDHIPPFDDVMYWADRCLRLADAEQCGDADAVDPSFDEEFAAFKAKWPRYYKVDQPDRT